MRLELTSAPHLGKNAYVRRIDGTYIREVSTDSYTGFRTLVFELDDGIYEIKEAVFGERKSNEYAISIIDGEIAETTQTLNDLLLKLTKIYIASWQIQGSDRAIDYAVSLCKRDFGEALKLAWGDESKIAKIEAIAEKAKNMEISADAVINRCKEGKLKAVLMKA